MPYPTCIRNKIYIHFGSLILISHYEKVLLQRINVNDRVLFSLCKLRLYIPLHVQRKCSEWIKLATTIFQDSFGSKICEILIPHALAPLSQ